MIRPCFSTASLAAAALLFVIQPMLARILLPVVGGSAAVWTTCQLFFQAVLVAGYCYAAVITRSLPVGGQVAVHAAVLAAGLMVLPVATHVSAPVGAPVPWLLGTLALSVGPPFFALSATAPLLQRWFAGTRDRSAGDPYFLYATSNAGSLGGLLAFPLLIEPLLSRGWQSRLFMLGYAGAAVAILFAGLCALGRTAAPPKRAGGPVTTPLSPRRRLWIVTLAAVPSSLMLGSTQHLTSDVAAIPLLWVLPLAVYLVTFMLAFANRPALSASAWGAVAPWAVAPATFFLVAGVQQPLPLIVAAHLGLLFVTGVMCHKRLFELRPAPERLTEFYLLISLGGVLGGAFNTLAAPLLFRSIVEYPLAIVAAWWLRPQAEADRPADRSAIHGNPPTIVIRAAAGLAVAGVVAAAAIVGADAALHAEWFAAATAGPAFRLIGPAIRAFPAIAVVLFLDCFRRHRAAAAAMTGAMLALPLTGLGGALMFEGRSFFGVHRVVLHPSGSFTLLRHGSTIHGVQARRRPGSEALAALSREPTTYYARSGPLGDVFALLGVQERLGAVAVVGLGAGTVAAYASPGMTLDFIELDPLVVRIAADRRLFTYLADATADHRGRVRGTVGDGRLRLAEQPPRTYDLVVIDAFASDSVPLHLLTREALAMYAERLRSGGLVAFNVSNRHFDLAPPIGAIAADLGLAAAVRRDLDITTEERERAKKESVWVAVGDAAQIDALRQRRNGWEKIPVQPDAAVWTDDYANLLGVFNGW